MQAPTADDITKVCLVCPIGGRGVGTWEGGQSNIGRRERFLGPQGSGTTFAFLRVERGGKRAQNGFFPPP